MFSLDNSTSSHGATKAPTNATLAGFELSLFSGTEGPEVANQLASTIQIILGRMNALSYLTTPLKEMLAQIPTPRNETARFKSFEMEDKILERWNKAYWTVRGFFKPGSPAFEQMKTCDETANLPEMWRIFNVHYVAAANFTGLFSLFYQLSGSAFVQKNLLVELFRQNDLQKRIVQLKTQPNSNFTGTPVKSFFNSPFLRRSLSMSSTPKKSKSTAKAITPSESEEGGDDPSLPVS
jgi:hypothetical protein